MVSSPAASSPPPPGGTSARPRCAGATARAQGAAIQVASLRAALPEYACCRPQYLQSSAPSRLPIHAAKIPNRCCRAMEKRCHSRMMLGQSWLSVRTSFVAVTKPPMRFLAHALFGDRSAPRRSCLPITVAIMIPVRLWWTSRELQNVRRRPRRRRPTDVAAMSPSPSRARPQRRAHNDANPTRS